VTNVNIRLEPTALELAVERIVENVENFSDVDNAEQKQWLIDQIMRDLLGEGYEKWRDAFNAESEQLGVGPWSEGVMPGDPITQAAFK
jgi:hypothetical protein